MVTWILPTAINLLDCLVAGRAARRPPPQPAGAGRWTARRSPLGLRPADLALLVGAVGIVRFCQLGPAGVIAQQMAQVRVGLMDSLLLLDPLQVGLPGLGAVHAQGGADLGPAVALL